MTHNKVFIQQEVLIDGLPIIFEGPLNAEALHKLNFHFGLCAFRPANQQKQALIQIASLDEGRIYVARIKEMVIGYVTFHYADPLERWSEIHNPHILELGAIEVAKEYRALKIASNILKIAFKDSSMDNYLIFTTGYYWHWDLPNTNLDVWSYRKIMEHLLNKADFICMATDDPEVCSHPANCLMVRVGRKVPHEAIDGFEQVRFQSRWS